MADERVKLLLEIEATAGAQTLGEIKKRAELVNEALEGAKIGSQEYDRLNQQLVQTNKQVKNLELGFEALDSEGVASQVGALAGGITDVATGLTLLSGGNETLEEMVAGIEQALGVSMALKGAIEGLQAGRKLYNDILARGNTLTKIAIGLQNGLANAGKALLSVYGLIAVAIVAIVAALSRWASEASVAEQAQKALNEASLEGAKAAGEEEAKLKMLAGTLMDATASTDARKDALKRLNDVIPDTIGFITEETIATGEAVAVIQKYIESVKVRAELAALEASFQDQVAKRVEKETELRLAGADANGLAGGIYKETIDIMKEGENVLLQQINNLQKQVSATEDSGDALAKTNQEVEKNTRFTKENTQAKSDNAEVTEELVDLTDRRAAAILELDKMAIDAIEDKYEKERALATFNFEQSIKDLDENLEEENDLIEAKRLELQDVLRQIDITEYEEQVVAEIEREFAELERLKSFEEEKSRIAKEEEDKRAADQEAARKVALQGAQDLLNATEKLANFQSAKELKRAQEKVKRGQALTDLEIKRLKRQDKINKAFALAQIAADTARGIASAVAAGAGLPFPANLGAIASGVAAVISGSVQAAQVMGESVEIPQVETGGADLGGLGGAASGATEGRPDNDFDFGSTILNQEQQPVLVVESVTEGINSVSVIESLATFG
jgi:hypothetical protein